MATDARPSLPSKVVQAEWEAMLTRLKEVARVVDHSHSVDALQHGYIILDPIGTDVDKAEEIILCNLLFSPRSRIEDDRTIEISGSWLWQWRRYTPWSLAEEPKPRWTPKARPDVRMYMYRLEQNVEVRL